MMRAKEELLSIKSLELRIAILRQEILELELKAVSIGGGGDVKVQTSPKHDKLESSVIAVATKQELCRNMIDEYFQKREEIVRRILALDDERFIGCLYKRYVQGMTLYDIADDMGYEYKWMCRIHGYALLDYERRYC